MFVDDCEECVRLTNESSQALVEWRYAQDALTLTPKSDPMRAARAKALVDAEKTVRSASRKRDAHYDSHGRITARRNSN